MRLEVNGVGLNLEDGGAGPPLLLLHGFTGAAATWRALRPRFEPYRRVIAPDLLGHGRSDAPADWSRYVAERCVEDLLALLDRLGLARLDLLGYSMGGRVALHLAAAAPERLRRLVLESASPGLADPAERAARVASDEALAASLERDGLAAFVDRWERLPLWASQVGLSPERRADLRRQRLANNPRGLAASLRGLGTGRQPPLWDHLTRLDLPTLLIVGALDPKFVQVGRQMAERLPNARLEIVAEAGHAVHLEQPAHFADLVLDFLHAEDPPSATHHQPRATRETP